MKLLLSLAFAATVAATGAAAAPTHDAVHLGPMPKEALALPKDSAGRHRSGVVRALPKAASLGAWSAEQGGYVARARATSEGAAGLRVRLDLGTMPGAVELRVQGDGAVETMTVDPLLGPEAWTPWTEGASQVIEVFSRVQPSEAALRIGAVVHMTEGVFAKAAASCTLSTACTTGDPVLDAAIAERKKSLLKISFVEGGGAFVCSATLIETPSRAPYVLTANHCLATEASAATVTSMYFFEQAPCGSAVTDPAMRQVAGGASMVFPNYNVDMTLVLMNQAPPPGVTYAPISATHIPENAQVVTLSHPRGDASRYTVGTVIGESRNFDLPYDMYLVRMTRGLIEPGSSGSGLYSLVNGSLQLRGVTSAADDELSCANSTGVTIFGRTEVMLPQMSQYIGLGARPADDAPNRVKDWANVAQGASGADVPLNAISGGVLELANKQINYPGDVDVYRFYLSAGRVVTMSTTGSIDTVGTLMDSAGTAYKANDDAETGKLNTGLTKYLPAGTYYAQVSHWDPTATGAYALTLRADSVGEANYTSLWWNPTESGWGINVNHQGNTVFATLFTYDTDGTPMWLVLSNGVKQPDGSFRGDLARTTGPVFNTQPWTSISLASVGTMTLSFTSADTGSLTYTVNGTQVLKSIFRQQFGALSDMPTCGWSAFDRSFSTGNFQDLWWNPAESGWGLNLAHQGNILFATLFTYGADRKARWFVMSNGARVGPGVYSGTLFQTQGPAFNAMPWTATTPTAVGNMRLTFTSGNQATLTYDINGVSVTKSIQRQVFSTPRVECEP